MVGIAQVTGHGERCHTLRPQRCDVIVETFGATGGEDDRMPCSAEAARDLQPEAGSGAEHERGRGGGYGHGFLLLTAVIEGDSTITGSRPEEKKAL
jgi:hypothetical protein